MDNKPQIGAYLNPEKDTYLESDCGVYKISAGLSVAIDIDKQFRHCGIFQLNENTCIDVTETTKEIFESYFNLAKEKLGLVNPFCLASKNTNTTNYDKAKELIAISKDCPNEIAKVLAKRIEELLSCKEE